jgi:hypothetical protein
MKMGDEFFCPFSSLFGVADFPSPLHKFLRVTPAQHHRSSLNVRTAKAGRKGTHSFIWFIVIYTQSLFCKNAMQFI